MSKIIDKLTCYCLDSIWRHIRYKTTREALIALSTPQGDKPAWLALDITYGKNADGEWSFDECLGMEAVCLEDWVKLPVRDYDLTIGCSRGEIRVPAVIVSQTFKDTIFRDIRLTNNNVKRRDRNVCQYSGRELGPGEGNVDHVIPRGRGGKNVWTNVVWSDKEINSKKGDKTPEEAGLKLITKPVEPSNQLMNFSRGAGFAGHLDWNMFTAK